MAGYAHAHWVKLKTPLKTKSPDVYKQLDKGFGPAWDKFESAAIKKIKDGMTDAQAMAAVKSEIAKVKEIAGKYEKILGKSFGDNYFDRKVDRYIDRFCSAVANGRDKVADAAGWAGVF